MRFIAVLVVIIACCYGTALAQKDDILSKPAATTVEGLQDQHLELLETKVDLAQTLYRTGAMPIEAVLRSHRELLSARLEYAKTNSDRIKLLEESLQNLKAAENIAMQRFKASSASRLDVIDARAARIKVELILLTEKNAERSESATACGVQPSR